MFSALAVDCGQMDGSMGQAYLLRQLGFNKKVKLLAYAGLWGFLWYNVGGWLKGLRK